MGHWNLGGKSWCIDTQWPDDCTVVVWVNPSGIRGIGKNTCYPPFEPSGNDYGMMMPGGGGSGMMG